MELSRKKIWQDHGLSGETAYRVQFHDNPKIGVLRGGFTLNDGDEFYTCVPQGFPPESIQIINEVHNDQVNRVSIVRIPTLRHIL